MWSVETPIELVTQLDLMNCQDLVNIFKNDKLQFFLGQCD